MQVYNDRRIPIIERYRDHWATDEVAKSVASIRRKGAYASGDAVPPQKYAYNAVNSSKRDPKAPRGRWDSASQSVKRKGKGKRARRTKAPAQDVSLSPPDPGDVGVHTVDINSSLTTSSGPQDAGPSRLVDTPGMSSPLRVDYTDAPFQLRSDIPSFSLSNGPQDTGPSRLTDTLGTLSSLQVHTTDNPFRLQYL